MLTRLVEEYQLSFDWQGFELHPETPKGGILVKELWPQVRTPEAVAGMKRFASSFGVTMGVPDRLPNTRKALAVAEFARAEGRLEPFRTAAMEAHWNRDEDLEDPGVLADLAVEAGLDRSAGSKAADDPVYAARVDAMGEEAARWGVTGIPTYFLLPAGWSPGDPLPPRGEPRPIRIVGCQPYATVEEGCKLAGVARR